VSEIYDTPRAVSDRPDVKTLWTLVVVQDHPYEAE